MTALHSVAESRLSDIGGNPQQWSEFSRSDHMRLHSALERTAAFWSAGEYVAATRAAAPLVARPEWVWASGSQLMCRARSERRIEAPVDYDRQAPAFVELREPNELKRAYDLLAEAFGAPVSYVEPRRKVIMPGPLHLRTWALFRDSAVQCCAMTVRVDDIVVICAVGTEPALQRRGHATLLMTKLHQLYERTGVVTDFASNPPIDRCALFEQLGYDPIAASPPRVRRKAAAAAPQLASVRLDGSTCVVNTRGCLRDRP